MQNIAAGLLMCRQTVDGLNYFLVHPGGPFFKNKDAGAWTIPKGLPEQKEDLITAAQREFFEETGIRPQAPFLDLGSIRQKNGKTVYAWAFAGDWDSSAGISSNTFILEWPPKSGRMMEFPEIDKAGWFDYHSALTKIIKEQVPLIDKAVQLFQVE